MVKIKINTKPVVEWDLYKVLVKAQAATGPNSFQTQCRLAEEESIKLIAKYPKEEPLKAVLVYIRHGLKSKKGSMSQQFISKAMGKLEESYR